MDHFLEKIDTHTLSLLQQGDEKAFDTIFWKYNPRVFHFIHSLLYDKILAEDLTQNVFLKIWERHQDIKPEEGFEAYLFTIARNMVYKETEKRLLSERFLDSIKQTDADKHFEIDVDTDSLQEYIDELVEQLPSSRKKIYLMSKKQHLTNKEIAAQLSLSEKTVETQLYRALHFLRSKLANEIVALALFFFLLILNSVKYRVKSLHPVRILGSMEIYIIKAHGEEYEYIIIRMFYAGRNLSG